MAPELPFSEFVYIDSIHIGYSLEYVFGVNILDTCFRIVIPER